MPGGWAWDEDLPTEEELRKIENQRRSYDRIAEVVERALEDPSSFTMNEDLLCSFHAIATAGEPDPRKRPGVIRTEDNQVGRMIVLHAPPPWQEVPRHLSQHLAALNDKLVRAPTLHAAAYALWSICWIHPFMDGNGRTARAVMYTILCVGYGRMLPGDPALPDLMAEHVFEYRDAIAAGHQAWNNGRGTVDVSEIEALLFRMLEVVLPDDERSELHQRGE